MGAHWRSHLTSALGAVIDGPLISVLVHNAVVDADAAVNANAVLNQLVLIRLGGKCRRSKETQILFIDYLDPNQLLLLFLGSILKCTV